MDSDIPNDFRSCHKFINEDFIFQDWEPVSKNHLTGYNFVFFFKIMHDYNRCNKFIKQVFEKEFALFCYRKNSIFLKGVFIIFLKFNLKFLK